MRKTTKRNDIVDYTLMTVDNFFDSDVLGGWEGLVWKGESGNADSHTQRSKKRSNSPRTGKST